ncbi:aspartate/glutamate racemase family protein [Streptomyces sp. JJ36]|uniref:maleate cis-trans isomerase family protein n=1 Tax=Streptomyces sp. JJ36 TaxID=2736645 RepID=UPI001F02D36A|nr:aspartate/glutamate racemase family protein [Streptomyces sp. JJ36]MCF6526000.1 aspartate/glutamate racemase family protein [Streptomyces sp. JJ36]
MDVSFLGGPQPQRGVGIVAPFDFALDRELWRWVPDDVSLHLTRTPFVPVEVSLDLARLVSEHETLREAVQALTAVRPEVVAYACTSGSFVGGIAGERAMSAAMEHAGETPALTTSGAVLDALRELDVRRVAVVTPYTKSVTDSLEEYLAEGGVAVTGRSYLGLTREIWRVPYRDVVDMAREAVVDAPDALFISCTNLPTYDVIPQLEAELRMPVLSANQVTMWAALRRVGKEAVGSYQALLDPVARRGPAAMTPSPPEPLGSHESGLAEPEQDTEPVAGPVGPAEPEAALAGAGAESPEPLDGLEAPGPAPHDEWGGQPPA